MTSDLRLPLDIPIPWKRTVSHTGSVMGGRFLKFGENAQLSPMLLQVSFALQCLRRYSVVVACPQTPKVQSDGEFP